jgi:REP element-mobilizing transposase RayT
MSKRCNIQVSEFPFHITARTVNRQPFAVSIEKVWEILSDELYFCNKKYGLEILSFVLMSNHFHLLATTRETMLGIVLNDFMPNSSKQMNLESGRINQNWGGRASRTLITDMNYLTNVYRYIYQNPMRAGLVTRAENYQFSTLHGLVGNGQLSVPVTNDPFLFDGDLGKNLDWINARQEKTDVEFIRSSLMHAEFKVPKDKYKGQLILKSETPPNLIRL